MVLPLHPHRYLRATDPFSLPDLRDEALALANMQQYEQAGQLCREYLAVAPGAADAGMVGEVLLQVQLAAEVARARARKQQRG
jgi:regulator of sirC expression with transglutaminase-like and TPR domain